MRVKDRSNPMHSPLSTMRVGIEVQVEIPQDLTRGQKKKRTTRSMGEKIKHPNKIIYKILY